MKDPVAKVVLFPTCSVEWNRPEIGRPPSPVLEKNRVEVAVDYPQCCGMPLFDVGDVDGRGRGAPEFVAALKSWVEKGYTIVTPGPVVLPHDQEGIPVARPPASGAPDTDTALAANDARPLRVPRGAEGEGPARTRLPERRRSRSPTTSPAT